MSRSTGHLTVAMVALLIAWPSAALGQSDWRTSTEVRNLYEAARAEGEVVIWGAQRRELAWIQEPFGKRFPGIEVKWTADRSAATKLITEYRASRFAVDLFHFSLGGMLPVDRRRVLGTNDWTIWGNGPEDVLLDGKVGLTHNLVYAVVYNEELVSADDLPTTWAGYLEPRWQGKLVASQFLLPRLLGFLALEWGEAKAADYARTLIDKQRTLITRAPREGILQRGERLVAVGEFVGSAMYWKSLGMPMHWAATELMPATQFGVATLVRAPHPHAAQLLAGWMTTDEAKITRERLMFSADVRPGSGSEIGALLSTKRGRIVFENLGNMTDRAALYERLSAIVTGQVR